jgi:hypothetical protein
MSIKVFAGILFSVLPAYALEVPEGCLRRADFPCALSSEKSRITHKLSSGGSLVLGQGAKILLRGASQVSVVQGSMVYLGQETLQVNHGEGRVHASGEVLFTRSKDFLQVRVLDGQIEISGPGIEKEFLTSGWSQQVGVLDPLKGRLMVEVAAPFQFSQTVTQWFQIRGALSKGMAQDLLRYKNLWQNALKKASQTYSEETSSLISQAQRERAERVQAEQKAAAETQRLRDLFRERTL